MDFMKDWWRFIDYYGQQMMTLVFIFAGAVIIFYGLEQLWKSIKRAATRSAPKEEQPDQMRKNERAEMRKHDPVKDAR